MIILILFLFYPCVVGFISVYTETMISQIAAPKEGYEFNFFYVLSQIKSDFDFV